MQTRLLLTSFRAVQHLVNTARYFAIFRRKVQNFLNLISRFSKGVPIGIGKCFHNFSKNFGKYFGPSTWDLKFQFRCPSFLLSKFASQLKLIQSAGRDTRNLYHKLNSQGPILRILGLIVKSSKSPGPSSRLWVPRSRVSGSQGLDSQGPRVLGLMVSGTGSQVLILDYAILLSNWKLVIFVLITNFYLKRSVVLLLSEQLSFLCVIGLSSIVYKYLQQMHDLESNKRKLVIKSYAWAKRW